MVQIASCFTTKSGVRFDHTVERAELNQYWYSPNTITALVNEVRHHATACAFLSTPSLYFAMAAHDCSSGDHNGTADEVAAHPGLIESSRLFEYDRQWKDEAGFVFYDFHRPEEIPVQYFGAFDYVIADPPFITEDVWVAYVKTSLLLLRDGGKLLFTTVMENHNMLEGLLDGPLFIAPFRPSIAHLTYQYVCFTNYKPTYLAQVNGELPPDDPKIAAAIQMANDLRESEKAFTVQAQQRDRRGEQPLPTTMRTNNAQTGNCASVDDATIIPGVPMSAMKWGHIPEGLTVYPNGNDAAPPSGAGGSGSGSESKVDYGETYHNIVTLRETIDNFKGQIDLLQKHLAEMLKLQQKRDKLEARGGEAVVLLAGVNDTMSSYREQFVSTLDTMRGLIASIEVMEAQLASTTGEASVIYVGAMRECVEAYATTPLEKQRLNELAADATRKYKSPLFNRMKELLQRIKDIKKSYQQQHRQEEEAEV
ncbi:unnamed protein product [Trypanosoma congolense IL3000]|uniref:WGS project CAEQ00000000 data, annotated contig 1353 n=1 Tax=Trypanosoma congolense (strain IL3000) TaxID=1068625 RepID=F9W5P2_TRYCI|nr:unnamed protein product [Trypanosoma congolense IL3000]